jgi:hypothetical protein
MYADNYYGSQTFPSGGWENNYDPNFAPPPQQGGPYPPYGSQPPPPYGPYGQPQPPKKKFSLFGKKKAKAPPQGPPPQGPYPGPYPGPVPDHGDYYGGAQYGGAPNFPPQGPPPPPPPPATQPRVGPSIPPPVGPIPVIPWTRGVENGIFRAGVLPSEDNISSQANPKDEEHFSQPWVLNTNAPLAWESLKIALLNRGSLIQEESHPTYILASSGKKILLEFFIDDFKREIHHRAIGADEDTLRKRIEVIRREYWPLAHGTLSSLEYWRPPTTLPRSRPIIEPMAMKEPSAIAPFVGEELPPVWSPQQSAEPFPLTYAPGSPTYGAGSPTFGAGSPTFGGVPASYGPVSPTYTTGFQPQYEAQFSTVPYY